jgi:hypothetical protein
MAFVTMPVLEIFRPYGTRRSGRFISRGMQLVLRPVRDRIFIERSPRKTWTPSRRDEIEARPHFVPPGRCICDDAGSRNIASLRDDAMGRIPVSGKRAKRWWKCCPSEIEEICIVERREYDPKESQWLLKKPILRKANNLELVGTSVIKNVDSHAFIIT